MSTFEDSDQETVEPGLRRYELKLAKRNLAEVASTSRDYGFMLAHQSSASPQPLGFCFLVTAYEFSAAVYAYAQSIAVPLEFTASFRWGYDGEHLFMEEYFRKSAQAIGVTYVELVNYFAARESTWRFEGWVDGENSDRRDNGLTWRALWGRLIETAIVGKLPLGDIPIEHQKILVDRLIRHAHEGQIILDR